MRQLSSPRDVHILAASASPGFELRDPGAMLLRRKELRPMNIRACPFSLPVRIVSVMLSFPALAAAQIPLSAAELERLRTISSWDIEYTESVALNAVGGGGPPPSSSWLTGFSLSHQENFVYSFKLTVGGGDCTTPSDNLPCNKLMSPANPGELRIETDEVFDLRVLNRVATDGGCWCNPPIESTLTVESSSISNGGSLVLDGTPGKPSSAWFGINTSVNPPRVSGSTNVFADFPGRQISTSCTSCDFYALPAGCTTVSDTQLSGYPHGWTNFEFGAEEQAGWGLTDLRVQVEDGHFVIRGQGVFNPPYSRCLFGPVYCGLGYQNLSCNETRVDGSQTRYASILIREHDAPAPIKIHSVEFTQAIQILQPLEVLKADLISDRSPPIPIVAKKPVALRIYPDEVTSRTTATFEVSGQVTGTKTMTLEPHCTPELRRRMEQGCVSANFYFTPPVGDWAVTVNLKSPSGQVLESHDLNLTSEESDALVLKGVSVCEAVDAQGNWQCGLVNVLPTLVGLLQSILPTDEVRVDVTGHQVRRNALDYDTDGDGSFSRAESDKWWVDVLKDIRSLYQLTDLYEELTGEQQNYYYGMIRNTAPGAPGAAFTNSRSAASRSYVLTLGFVNWTQYVVAHETAHMLGRDHTSSNLPAASNSIGCWGPGAAPQDWPYADNLLRSGPAPGVLQVGFDVENGEAVLPERNFEISAYCSDGWVSPYSYPKLRAALNPQPSPASALAAGSGQVGSYWRVAGTISGAAAVLEPLFTMDVLGTTEAGIGSHRIEVLDGSGIVLFTRHFTPESVHISPGPDDEPDAEPDPYFTELVPIQPGAAVIHVIDVANSVIGSVSLGGLVPSVTVMSPMGGETISGPHAITWSVLDVDSANHTFDVYYSNDGGANWRGVGRGLDESTLNVDFGTLAGTVPGDARVRVIASDGVNTGVGTSGGFTVSKKQPSATIVFPSTDDRFTLGALVLLQGVGFDADDGLLAAGSLLWSSDVDGPLGSADDLPVYNLSPARHRITFTATDTDGNTASTDVVISVFDPPTADGDGDDDVDLGDYLRLNGCWAGLRSSPSEPACLAFDFDSDGDVDALDFAAFQNCFSGTNVLASPDCAR